MMGGNFFNMHNDLLLIQKTLQSLDNETGEKLLRQTYERFFAACPAAAELWEKDDPVSRGKMFNGVILSVFDHLARPDIGEKNLRSDIRDHDDYGVSTQMYGMFFSALLETLSAVLGEGFDEDMAQAWERQLNGINSLVHKYTSQQA